MTEETKALASERQHFYYPDGRPAYEVPCKSKEGNRPTNIKDAKELGLVPSVTLILNQLSKPGLEAWKARQLLEAALTLPRLADESLDDYATRVIEDSKAQSAKARDRGTDLHAAIEDYIRGQTSLLYQKHCEKVELVLNQYGIPLRSGNPERSFASELYYGGKIDYSYDSGIIVDFKTKDRLDKKTKPYDEHLMQCAAYGYGLFIPYGYGFVPKFRAFNVFVGIDDCEVRVFEHDWKDLSEAFELFQCLLTFYLRKNKLGQFKE